MSHTNLESPLVDRSWVARHGNDPGVRVVEVDVDTTAYDSGHVPGAVAFDWKIELQDPVRRDIVGPEWFARLLGRSGMSNDTMVVLYGDHNNWFAAYAAWLFRYYGHRAVKLMDGGRAKWVAEGRPLTTERPRVPPATYLVSGPDRSLRATREEVLAIVNAAERKTALVDVRSEAEYSGELIAVYPPLGVTPDGPVVTYCRIGERSAHTWFVLREILRFPDVRNYDGSWTEWGSMIGMPIEREAPVAAPAGA